MRIRAARQTGANLGFEDKLWMAADKLRGTMDAAEYKHVVLGLIIDARNMGALIDRTHRELSADEIAEIAGAYHAWRGEAKDGAYEDRPGFCKSATLDDIASHDFVLTPGRYVGAEAVADDGIPFEEKMAELSGALYQQMRESVELDAVIRDNLGRLGFGE